jgi:hypothetical protein
MVVLIKQVGDVTDLISEREGVKAVARDSPGQDDTLLFLALVALVFLEARR